MPSVSLIVIVLSLFHLAAALESALNSPWLNANFRFDWTRPGVNVSVPTTAQCDRINITWTPLNNGSPDPVPPYHLRIYTSTLTYPIIVDAGTFSPFEWTVPFPPETQYQICMFDSRGQTGGCQDKYTVIPPTNSTQGCTANFATPNTLSIQGVTETGPLTQYGWPDQCTTLTFMAQNGTPPYNMTIAPSLHPPLNLTFNDMGPMKWTLTLPWGMQFWISIVDSLGASWAYGPLHSGGNGPTDCLRLAGNSLAAQIPASTSSRHTVSSGGAVGIAFGSLVFGILFTLAAQWLLGRFRRRNDPDHEEARIMPSASRPMRGIDPYTIGSISSQPLSSTRPVSDAETNPIMPGERNDSQVYVVHHDAGGAPITIFTGGRDVQELPPHYSGSGQSPEPTAEARPGHASSASHDSTTSTSRTARRTKGGVPLRSVSG